MKQLTIRVTEPEVRRRIEELAEREHLSLNQAVLKLLRRAVGLGADALEEVEIGDDILRFSGRWSQQEANEFDDAVRIFDTIDDEFWK